MKNFHIWSAYFVFNFICHLNHIPNQYNQLLVYLCKYIFIKLSFKFIEDLLICNSLQVFIKRIHTFYLLLNSRCILIIQFQCCQCFLYHSYDCNIYFLKILLLIRYIFSLHSWMLLSLRISRFQSGIYCLMGM